MVETDIWILDNVPW